MRVAKALIFDARGNALILQRSNTHPHWPHEADLPGGIVEYGESYEEGLAREILEETGLTVMPQQLVFATERDSLIGSAKQLYTVILNDRPDVKLSWEHDGFAWVEPGRLLQALASKDDYMTIAADYVRHEL